jgi:UDP-N-acetylbacillosamine N-acetyltransferase
LNLLVIRIGGFEMRNEDFLGIGSAVIPYVSIVSNAVIGAGATVIENIDNAGVYVGTPARRIKD